MPLYLYYGDETYMLQRAIKALRTQVVDPAMAAFSYQRVKNPSIYQLTELIGAVSLNLGGDTLLEVQEFEFLSKAASDTSDERALEVLKQSLLSVEPTKHVLFVQSKLDRKIKFPKWLASQPGLQLGEYKKLEFYKTDEAVHQIIQESKRSGIVLEPPAAQLLVDQMGVDLQTLMNEIEKLAIYAYGRSIKREDVVKLSNHNENTFQMLSDWIQGHRREQVFHTLEELLLRQHPVQLFALTQTYLNNAFRLVWWQSLGWSQAEMAERSKKHPFKVKKDLQEFGRVPLTRLTYLKELAIKLEWQFKTGQLPDRLAFEILMGS